MAPRNSITHLDGTWQGTCPGYPDNACGPWRTSGWLTRKAAEARLDEHLAEHETYRQHGRLPDGQLHPNVQLMTPLHEFRAAHGHAVVGGVLTLDDGPQDAPTPQDAS